ncbi:hypothetical protein D3C85_1276450 [compost metagenome]
MVWMACCHWMLVLTIARLAEVRPKPAIPVISSDCTRRIEAARPVIATLLARASALTPCSASRRERIFSRLLAYASASRRPALRC